MLDDRISTSPSLSPCDKSTSSIPILYLGLFMSSLMSVVLTFSKLLINSPGDLTPTNGLFGVFFLWEILLNDAMLVWVNYFRSSNTFSLAPNSYMWVYKGFKCSESTGVSYPDMCAGARPMLELMGRLKKGEIDFCAQRPRIDWFADGESDFLEEFFDEKLRNWVRFIEVHT